MRIGRPCLAALFLAAPRAAAQVSARLDLSTGNRYVWHGVSRGAGWVAQPSLALGWRLDRLSLAGGAVLHYELDHVSPSELSETGVGAGPLGETDYWGQASWELGPARLRSGIVRYSFHGDSTAGGLGLGRNTTELYARLSATSTYANPSLEAWWDVDRVHGAFVSASADLPILGWPYPPYTFLYAHADLGMNLGQGPNAARPAEPANFAGRGLTHVGFGLATEIAAGRVSGVGRAAFAIGVRTQLNLDDATRADGSSRRRDWLAWVWMGVTMVVDGRAEQ